MSDGKTLLLVICLIYLSDCVLWIKNQSVAFVSPWYGQWRVALANFWIGNDKGSLMFLNPLPPLGRLFVSHLMPVSVSPTGVCAFNGQALFRLGRTVQSGACVTFDAINKASSDGVCLLINEQRFTKCATSRQAKSISDLINAAKETTPPGRERLISAYIHKQFAIDEASMVLHKVHDLTKPIRSMCCFLFIFLFVASPIIVTTLGLLRTIIPVAVGMILFAVQISLMFYRAHKALYPREISERWENLIKMIVCPPVAIRAVDVITKHALSEYSPVVLGDLFSGSAAQQFVRRFILDLQHPLAYEAPNATSQEIIAWAAGAQLTSCFEYLTRWSSLTEEEVLAPPQRDGNSISYCPRCGGQFLVRSDGCPDCPGVGLREFSDIGELNAGGAAWLINRNG
jgi:hypothetical protein